jgi:hypothetical protein
MVSKCANPNCSMPFLYLHNGKLFRLDSGGTVTTSPSFDDETGIPHADRRVEFFWLCNQCAARMTLSYQKGSGVRVEPRVWSAAA